MTRHTYALLLIAALTTGCRYGEVLAFGGGGKAVSEDDTGGGSSTGDDSGMPMDDSGGGPSGGAPSVLDVQTSVEEYPDISWVVELTITYTDPEGDVDGGAVELMTEIDGQDPLEVTVPIDGSQAINDSDDGTVFLAVSVNDGDVSGVFSVVLVDASGNMSEPYDKAL